MSILILGGTGFIGRRLVPLLAKRGEEIVCMDINPQTADFSEYGKQVRVMRGDVSQFDDVMAAMANAKPERVINLAYWLGSEHPPRPEIEDWMHRRFVANTARRIRKTRRRRLSHHRRVRRAGG